jgi:hypothetical protein
MMPHDSLGIMRLRRSDLSLLVLALLAPTLGCKNDNAAPSDPAANAVSQALAQAANAQAAAASAQAMGQAMLAQTQTSVTGKVHSAGGELGTWDATLSDCQSGERNGFYGADFYVPGSDDLRLRYVHDEAAGEVVKIAIPSKKDEFMVFDRAAKCSVLEGSVEKTNVSTSTTHGNIRHVNGHVKFACTDSHGKGHVTGEVTFSDCH